MQMTHITPIRSPGMDSESIEAAAAQWIIRRHGEAWTDADQRELDSWLEESTFHRVAYLRLDSVWQQTDRLKALGQDRRSAMFRRRVHGGRDSRARRRPWRLARVGSDHCPAQDGWYWPRA